MNKKELFLKKSIWIVNLDPTIGSELKKTRPAVIISRSDYNKVSNVVTIIPVSTGRYIESLHIKLSSLNLESHAVIPQMRVVSKERLIKNIGMISTDEEIAIHQKMKFFFDL